MKLQFPSTNKMGLIRDKVRKSEIIIEEEEEEEKGKGRIYYICDQHTGETSIRKHQQRHCKPPPLPQVLIQKRNQQSFYLKFPISILSNLVDQKVILLYLEALSKYLRLSTGRVCAQFDHFKSPRMALVADREEASVWMSQVSSGISWMSIRFAKSIYGGNSLDLAKILLNLARSHHISSNKDQI